MPPTLAPVAESRWVQDGSAAGRELRGMSRHRRVLMGNPNA
jgi:hypothetical protein